MDIKLETKTFDDEIARVLAENPAKMEAAMKTILMYTVKQAQFHLDKNSSVITSALKNHMASSLETSVDSVTGRVGSNAATESGVQYAKFVEFGRGPVFPVNGKALKMEIGGKTIYRKSAKAAKAKPFLKPALDDTALVIADIVRESLAL